MNLNKSLLIASEMGYRDFKNGDLISANPYHSRALRIAYAEGWEEAEYEAILSQKIIAHKAKKVNLVIVK